MTTTEHRIAVPAPAGPTVAGAAVDLPAPVLGSLSPSRAGDFLTCPLLYRFRTIDRLPQGPSSAATRGTLVHAVLDRLFDLPAAERTLSAARTFVEPEWERLLVAEPDVAELFEATDGTPAGTVVEWLASARELLAGYFALEDPTRLEPAEREHYVETVLPSGLRLRGYIDRLDQAPTGELRVVDYKTGRAPGEAFEARALFQMKFYALVLWRTRGTVPRELRLLYLGDREMLRYSPDEAELRAFERKLGALWQAIERATETGDWRPRKSRLCDWCDHQALCPEFGGTPPPLPERAEEALERAGDLVPSVA
ncbi:MAG: RecB family exonuclease [Mycobacteriales bacterium]